MRKILLFIVAVLAMTTSVFALEKTLKEVAFARSAPLVAYGYCEGTSFKSCSTCDSNDWRFTSTERSATFIGINQEGSGVWLSTDEVDMSVQVSIDGHEAIRGISGVGWALYTTPGYYIPGTVYHNYNILSKEELFYVNEAKIRTVTKLHAVTSDAFFIEGDTCPDNRNIGAGVFNHIGELVGIVVGPVKPDSCNDRGTRILRLTDDVFEMADLLAP